MRVCGEALELEERTAALRKALCTYDAGRAAMPGIIRAHHAALVRNGQYWQRVPILSAMII